MDLLDNNKSAANVSGGVVSEGEPALSSETPEKKIKEEKEQQKEVHVTLSYENFKKFG